MRRLSEEAFNALTATATPIAHNDQGVSVMRLDDGRFIKLFRRRRRVSSDLLRPYAKRFQRAAALLRDRGFRTVAVEDIASVGGSGLSLAVYRGVPGEPLRDLLATEGNNERFNRLVTIVARLFAALHEAGVYFRANHFGNIVIDGDDQPALIDIAEARFRAGPLSMALRARNFKPPLRYDVDRAAIERFGASAFIDTYIAAAKMDNSRALTLRAALRSLDPIFAAC